MKWSWDYVATFVERDYGAYVDWDEEFFECPECGEPLLNEDWPRHDWDICPICGFEFFSENLSEM